MLDDDEADLANLSLEELAAMDSQLEDELSFASASLDTSVVANAHLASGSSLDLAIGRLAKTEEQRAMDLGERQRRAMDGGDKSDEANEEGLLAAMEIVKRLDGSMTEECQHFVARLVNGKWKAKAAGDAFQKSLREYAERQLFGPGSYSALYSKLCVHLTIVLY